MSTLNSAMLAKCTPRTYEVISGFGGSWSHPIYFDRFVPTIRRLRAPMVLIHGACNTGVCYLATPDGRPGWAHDLACAGIETWVIDWPGHGRSPMRDDFLSLSSRDVRDSLAELLGQCGPAVLLAHSAGGPIMWSLAEIWPERVVALVGVAAGPPANLLPPLRATSDDNKSDAVKAANGHPILPDLTKLYFVDERFVAKYWFSGSAAPPDAARKYFRSVVPESPRIICERFNVDGKGLCVEDPEILGSRPILMIGPECDPRHPEELDRATAELFGADFIWLPDEGLCGNGHMMMGDTTSAQISQRIAAWLFRRLAALD
jgi:pimeloyl-ACP methyl ester carboxylesterase